MKYRSTDMTTDFEQDIQRGAGGQLLEKATFSFRVRPFGVILVRLCSFLCRSFALRR